MLVSQSQPFTNLCGGKRASIMKLLCRHYNVVINQYMHSLYHMLPIVVFNFEVEAKNSELGFISPLAIEEMSALLAHIQKASSLTSI